jgi:hypothetical protein
LVVAPITSSAQRDQIAIGFGAPRLVSAAGQNLDRAGELTSLCPVRRVQLEILVHRRTIILADRVADCRIAEGETIGFRAPDPPL